MLWHPDTLTQRQRLHCTGYSSYFLILPTHRHTLIFHDNSYTALFSFINLEKMFCWHSQNWLKDYSMPDIFIFWKIRCYGILIHRKVTLHCTGHSIIFLWYWQHAHTSIFHDKGYTSLVNFINCFKTIHSQNW